VLSLGLAFPLFTHSSEPPGSAPHTKPRGQHIGPHCLACEHSEVSTRVKAAGRASGLTKRFARAKAFYAGQPCGQWNWFPAPQNLKPCCSQRAEHWS
jgi:hypothetical protein